MGDFFKGWRRKFGLLTLMMALLFMGGWVRSLTYVIEIEIPGKLFPWSTSQYICWATPRGVELERAWSDNEGSNYAHPNGRFQYFPVLFLEIASQRRIENHWQMCGFNAEEGRWGKYGRCRVWVVPYWSVTIPLTLISAFLLLSKPRKSIQKKTAEPISAEGK